jgi:hypothetical protein
MNSLPNTAPHAAWLDLTQCLLNSFRRWTGKELLDRSTADAAPTERGPRSAPALEEDLLRLWNAPQVVVAHGTQSDPIFEYGNQKALDLWEMQLDEFLGMPSRLTAEPMHRDERKKLLERTRQHGYVDDYRGVRISRTGKRFMIEEAVLWTVLDHQGLVIGQAATFDHWTVLT